jgi:predicted Zn-dependent protease with MMP-like domain
MGQALAHRPFADALQEASLLMGPMTRQELHTAIEQPAEMQGAAFEAGLVERILDDVGEKPGNLPLLEFTLTQLWERQTTAG